MTRNKMGRPKLAKDEKKSIQVGVRLTPKEASIVFPSGKINMSEWLRRIINHHCKLPWEKAMEVIHGPRPSIGWGSSTIRYTIMTDCNGVKWKVPTEIDGKPVEYLRKHDPDETVGTYDRVYINDRTSH